MQELEIYEVFPTMQPHDSLYAGSFDSNDYPYKPAPPVRCNYYSAFFIQRGQGFLVVDNYEYEVKPNRIFLFNDRQVIGWSYYEDTVGLVVAFTAPVALELSIWFDKPYIDITDSEAALFTPIFLHCISEFRKSDPVSSTILRAAIRYLAALCSRNAGAPDIHDKTITAFRNRVCTHFASISTVDQLAAALHTSPKDLTEKTQGAIGMTAKQYLLELKLTEAKRLLVFTPLTAAEICYETGFEDPSYFSRFFRKKTGLTPTAYRQKYQR
ncbi:helix-turn-helix domain-containing protein [Nibrella saemangeumensis]|uniref:Helix-turn-helix domain-containing protein n=1 Tax=Nibrella saemangeumensis TaxID=1084526 RepID=A0ABP8MQ32_9BACT